MTKYNLVTGFLAGLFIFLSQSAFSQDEVAGKPKPFKLDEFMRSVDFSKQVNMQKVLNLAAQFTKDSLSTTNVDDFDNFVIVAIDPKGNLVQLLEFDRNQKIKNKNQVPGWIGTYPYSLKKIPQTTIQEGLDNVRMCMANKGQPIRSREIAGVIIYNLVQAQGEQMQYDYVFTDPMLPKGRCREYVYTPPNNVDPNEKCQIGYAISCRFDVNDMVNRPQVKNNN